MNPVLEIGRQGTLRTVSGLATVFGGRLVKGPIQSFLVQAFKPFQLVSVPFGRSDACVRLEMHRLIC